MASFTWPVISVGAPVGGATEAKQDAQITILNSIDSKTPGLTDAQLRATPVPVSGPLTDGQLRATPVPVSGTVTATGPLTDAQLRATPVPVSGTVVTGGLTDAQLRATPVPVSGTVTAAGAATETTLLAINTKTPALGQAAMAASVPVVLASNQSALPTRAPVNPSGAIVNTTLSGTTASSAVAPANAVGFVFEADSTNTDPVRWAVGGTASASVGMLCEPGRDTGFIPIGFGATISICAVANSGGPNTTSIQWVLSV